ncbi:hypothetical protein CSUI_011195 [Cystoisospora suis]|uniref:Uncharacterized protein n=1 Tax=Cystoisospora suis TaxID=483139 RepID=A0A2C6KEZ0_9APIC|nr:hypothetical protein CSUI_011195 [Cystoisospora suis]
MLKNEEDEESEREEERSIPSTRRREGYDTHEEDACTTSSLYSSRFLSDCKDSARYKDRMNLHSDKTLFSSSSPPPSLTPYQELQEFGKRLLGSVGFFYTNVL